MAKFTVVALFAFSLLPLSVLPAAAVTEGAAQHICVKAAAERHSELQGNVQVRRVVQKNSGFEVNLQVKGVEANCMITPSGKVRSMN